MIYKIYKDFIKFLEKIKEREGNKLEFYRKYYLDKHFEFLMAYWKSMFSYSPEKWLYERVNQIKYRDYKFLIVNVKENPPEFIVEDTLRLCRKVSLFDKLPDVYLFVGFFSSDGATFFFKDSPVIAIGLERFFDFADMKYVVAHEYGHFWFLSLCKMETKYLWQKILKEGLAFYFTKCVFKNSPLYKILLMHRRKINACISQESIIINYVKGNFYKKFDGSYEREINYLSYKLIYDVAKKFSFDVRSLFYEASERGELLLKEGLCLLSR